MLKTTKFKSLLAGLLIVAMLLIVPLTLAQEATAVPEGAGASVVSETAAVATQAPPGGGLLFLLIGLGAVVVVSGIWLVRERIETNPDTA